MWKSQLCSLLQELHSRWLTSCLSSLVFLQHWKILDYRKSMSRNWTNDYSKSRKVQFDPVPAPIARLGELLFAATLLFVRCLVKQTGMSGWPACWTIKRVSAGDLNACWRGHLFAHTAGVRLLLDSGQLYRSWGRYLLAKVCPLRWRYRFTSSRGADWPHY